MKRALLAVLTLLACAVGAGFWYFRSSDTRLTIVPPPAGVNTVAAPSQRLSKPPRSIIVFIEENKSYEQIFDHPGDAPYLNGIAKEGAVFTHSYGVAHPSQPNYFALFSGRTNSNGDGCPAQGIPHDADNLGAEIISAHRTFRAYAEDLPRPGFAGCTSGQYARKHAPWTHFTNIPAQDAVPFSALASYETLPDIAFIIPNLRHDMHSGSIRAGDTWLHEHAAPLIAWAKRNDAVVIITWDESSAPFGNHIPTLLIGPMVKPGRYDEVISHYRVLRTIEDLFALRHAGLSKTAMPILDCWTT
jgi:hypothetical protein